VEENPAAVEQRKLERSIKRQELKIRPVFSLKGNSSQEKIYKG
jgi:hypothetical protein